MSLPPTTKDISTHPGPNSVSDPVDKSKLDRDVSQKLKLYSTIQALRASRLPSNKQVDALLAYFKKSVGAIDKRTETRDASGKGTTQTGREVVGSKPLSKDTQILFKDFQEILDAVSAQVHEKNGDELIQEFVWQTRIRDLQDGVSKIGGTSKDISQNTPGGPSKEKRSDDADTAVEHIRTLLNLLLTNSEARKLLSDFSVVGRDLLSRGAGKAAEGLAPAPEELARVDESTKRDEFADDDPVGGAAQRKDELQARLPGKEEVRGEAEGQARNVQNQGGVDPRADSGVTGGTRPAGEVGREVDDKLEEEDAGGKKTLYGRIKAPFQDSVANSKDLANQHATRGKKFLTEDYFPKERREQWIWRGKKVIIELQSHPEYQSSIRWLLDFVKEYYQHGVNYGKSVRDGHVEEAQRNPEVKGSSATLQQTLATLRTLLDRFAGGRSFDRLILDKLDALAQDARNDDELRTWVGEGWTWIEKILLEPGYILEPQSSTEGSKWVDRGRKFYGTGNPKPSEGGDYSAGSSNTGYNTNTSTQAGFGATSNVGASGVPAAGYANAGVAEPFNGGQSNFQGQTDTTRGQDEYARQGGAGGAAQNLARDLGHGDKVEGQNPAGAAKEFAQHHEAKHADDPNGSTNKQAAAGIAAEIAQHPAGAKVIDKAAGLASSKADERVDAANDGTSRSADVAAQARGAFESFAGGAEKGRYTEHFEGLFEGVGEWASGWGEDKGNQRVARSLSKFTKDLLFIDSDADGQGGRLAFKREMWGDIKEVILPLIVDKVGYVPIPRIEYTDDMLDLVVENLTLQGRNLFPNVVAVEAHNYMKFSPYSGIRKTQSKATNAASAAASKATSGNAAAGMDEDADRHEIIITLSQMQADMRDVAFYFKKKSGIPKLSDSGLADVVVGGDGVGVTIHLSSTKNDPTSFFNVKNVHVTIDSLKFSIRDSKHDLLYKTLKPLATGLVKKQIAKAIKDAITTALGVVDGQLVSVRDRLNEVKTGEAEGVDEKGRLGVLQDMFKRQKSDIESKAGSIKSSAEKSNSQFKVVSDKRHSLLNEGHPAGWVNRAATKDDFTGASGDGGWRCDAFDVDMNPANSATKASPNTRL